MAPQKHCGVNAFSRTCIILCILSLAPCNPLSPNPDAIKTNEIPRRNTADETPSDEICAACHSRFLHKGQRKASKLDVKLEEIRRIAIEKKKILDRLGLPARPNITDKDRQYPEKITEEMKTIPQPDIPSEHENSAPRANTRGLYLFAEPPSTGRSLSIKHCQRRHTASAMCFNVTNLLGTYSTFSIYSAVLTLHRLSSRRTDSTKKYCLNHFMVEEISLTDGRTIFRNKTYRLPSMDLNKVKLNVKDLLESWPNETGQGRIARHMIRISCKNSKKLLPVAIHKTEPTYIRVGIQASRLRRRTDPVCYKGSQCCLKERYVNFTRLGFSDFVLGQEGVFYNYCFGKCTCKDNLKFRLWNRTHSGPQPACCYSDPRTRGTTVITIFKDNGEPVPISIETVNSCRCSNF